MSEGLSFRLEVFEGPLDLLLSLITKNKINIYDIPIASLLDQYLDYLEQMRRMDMDIAGEFITMAAELMLIKSRMMLPSAEEEEEEDPRLRLAEALTEYKKAKEAAQELSGMYEKYGGRIAKEPDETVYYSIPEITDQQVSLLEEAFERILERRKLIAENTQPEPERLLKSLLNQKVTPIPEKIRSIIRHVEKCRETTFEELMYNNSTKSELVASFVAVLQLLAVRRLLIVSADDTDIVLKINEEITGEVDSEEWNEI